MDCSWRRTLASVFLLLSPHSVRVLSQNVVPNGSLPPLPLLREPLRDGAGANLGPVPQHMNLLPGPPNGMAPEFMPVGPYGPEYQRIPEYQWIPECIGPGYPQAPPFNSVPQGNIGPFPQGPMFNIPQINNNLPLQQGPCNGSPNTVLPPLGPPIIFPTPLLPIPLGPNFNIPPITNIPPQGLPPNISPVPLVPGQQNPSLNIPPITQLPYPQGLPPHISSVPLVLPHIPGQQSPSLNIPPITQLPYPQGVPPHISQVPLVPTSQSQIQPGTQLPLTSTSGPAWNAPPVSGLQNQNMQTFPLVSNSYQPVLPAAGAPCTLSTDLTSIHFLPPPNIPSSIPIQNCVPTPQPPFQTMVYPQPTVPFDLLPSSPILSQNYQISALPPVFPANPPEQYDNPFGISPTVSGEYNPLPINLQINVPSPAIPEPKITIITAYPSAPAPPDPITTSDNTDNFGMYPSYPLPPIIIEGRRSKSRSWLPLILVALFTRDGYGGGCSSGCCCCPCSPAIPDTPVPYPIPIPTNNPIIVGNACCSRKKESKTKTSDKKRE